MILRFLTTKIGVALLVTIMIIGATTTVKIKNSRSANKMQQKVGLMADLSVEAAIKNGNFDNSNWENVLKAVAGTSTDNLIATLNTPSTSTEENLTATDRFARAFFTKYVYLKQSGRAIDETAGTDLVNQLLAEDYGGPAEEKIYTETDIKIQNTTSLDDLKKYGNTLGTIIKTPLPKDYEQELIIIGRVNDTGNTKDLKKLSLNINHYQNMRDKILVLSVPIVLKPAHLSLINSLSAILEGVRGMTLIETDPVGATKMIVRYEDGLKSLPLFIQKIKVYFAKQNVTFSPNEGGYILTQ